MNTDMQIFATDAELRNAYIASQKPLYEEGVVADWAKFAGRASRYVPHLYRGGRVIPGFGYSVERISKYVAAERAGNPEAIK